ncbi:MAG: beta-N-acetylhexosaminidase, partial [Candidatus Ratteibacteria bacterium]
MIIYCIEDALSNILNLIENTTVISFSQQKSQLAEGKMEKLLFLPVPRKIKVENQLCNVPSHAGFFISGFDDKNHDFFSEYIKKISQRFTKNQWTLNSRRPFFTLICDHSLNIPQQGYRLTVSHDSIKAESSDASGAYYALCTLKQILIQKKSRLPVLTIEDYPDFKHRGVMIDISRSKVPKMKTLYNLVDLFSGWKINQLQLYTEHTFAYKNHKIVWEGKSPVTAEEIRNLDDYCKQRFVELVPNQNSFGHFHRWLQHSQYRHLAEDPENPYNLCPVDQGSIHLLEDLYQQLLPNFSSNQFNVGCDETSIGKRSAGAVKEKGEGRVYLEFLLKIYQLVKKHGKTMQFWGDIIQRHPELISELPEDVIVLEWGYEAEHPFEQRCRNIARTGIPFYVCPGTSSWNSIAGRTENCLGNLVNAAKNGIRFGAIGMLNTDWGDNGHWQYLPVSYIGFGYGAGVSWCFSSNID